MVKGKFLANLIINKNKWSDKNKSKNKAKCKKCYYCRKLGHFIKKCYKKKNESAEKKFDGGNAVLVYDKYKLEDGLVFVNMEKKLNDEWILKTYCLFNMCPNKNCFLDFEKTASGKL